MSGAFLAGYEAVGRSRDPIFRAVAAELESRASDITHTDRAWRAEPFYEILGHGELDRRRTFAEDLLDSVRIPLRAH